MISASGLLAVARIARLEQFAAYDSSNYKAEDYLSDLTGMVFAELGKGKAVDSYRRYLQRRFVTVAIEVIGSAAAANTDARALLLGTLTDIQKRAAKAKSSDMATQAHWQAISAQIDQALKK